MSSSVTVKFLPEDNLFITKVPTFFALFFVGKGLAVPITGMNG